MEPIRVLCIVFSAMNTGGAETMLMNYYRNINREKVQFDFLCQGSQPGAFDQEIITLGGRIYKVPTMGINILQYLKKSYQIISKYKIVHVHQDVLGAVPLILAQIAGVPVRIAHSHNTNFIETKGVKKYMLRLCRWMVPRLATYRMACGKDAGRALFANYPFEVLPNAIDVNRFRRNRAMREKMRRQQNIAEDTIVIGHVGRFVPAKNHDFLLEIMEAFYKICPNSQLWLFGEGPLEEKIREKISRRQLQNNVKFMGIRLNINEYMQAMDAFLFPSVFEGFPVVLIEAQAAAIPCVVSSNCSETVEITKHLRRVSLEKNAGEWAKIVLKEYEKGKDCWEKEDILEEMESAHMDISIEAEKLCKKYIELSYRI